MRRFSTLLTWAALAAIAGCQNATQPQSVQIPVNPSDEPQGLSLPATQQYLVPLEGLQTTTLLPPDTAAMIGGAPITVPQENTNATADAPTQPDTQPLATDAAEPASQPFDGATPYTAPQILPQYFANSLAAEPQIVMQPEYIAYPVFYPYPAFCDVPAFCDFPGFFCPPFRFQTGSRVIVIIDRHPRPHVPGRVSVRGRRPLPPATPRTPAAPVLTKAAQPRTSPVHTVAVKTVAPVLTADVAAPASLGQRAFINGAKSPAKAPISIRTTESVHVSDNRPPAPLVRPDPVPDRPRRVEFSLPAVVHFAPERIQVDTPPVTRADAPAIRSEPVIIHNAPQTAPPPQPARVFVSAPSHDDSRNANVGSFRVSSR